MAKKLLTGLIVLVAACAYTNKFKKADPYYCDSLIDCVKKGPPEEEYKGDYEIFSRISTPISITDGSRIITYIENLDGSGYCLSVKVVEDNNMYCSLNSQNNLDAYSWSYKSGNQTRSMTVLKSETPLGVNGKNWQDLDWEFREAQFIFGNKIKDNQNYLKNLYYKGAVKRIRGFNP